MLRVKVLQNRRVKRSLKLIVVAFGLAWCSSAPRPPLWPARPALGRLPPEEPAECWSWAGRPPVSSRDAELARGISLARAHRVDEARAVFSGLLSRESERPRQGLLLAWLAWCQAPDGGTGDARGHSYTSEEYPGPIVNQGTPTLDPAAQRGLAPGQTYR